MKVEGLAQLQKRIKEIENRVDKARAKAGATAAQLVRSEAVRSIQEQSPGQEVTRTRADGNTYTHIAAAEGHAPNTDTSALVRSIEVEPIRGDYYVGTNIEYGAKLEFGDHNTGPRPWLNPALNAKRAEIIEVFRKEVEDAAK